MFDQTPPASGVPFKAANNSASEGVSPWQTLSVPLIPALGATSSVTTTSALALGQTPDEFTVYV